MWLYSSGIQVLTRSFGIVWPDGRGESRLYRLRATVQTRLAAMYPAESVEHAKHHDDACASWQQAVVVLDGQPAHSDMLARRLARFALFCDDGVRALAGGVSRDMRSDVYIDMNIHDYLIITARCHHEPTLTSERISNHRRWLAEWQARWQRHQCGALCGAHRTELAARDGAGLGSADSFFRQVFRGSMPNGECRGRTVPKRPRSQPVGFL